MSDRTHDGRPGPLQLWLFPLTYLLHAAEEFWCGGGYTAYVLRTRGVEMSSAKFLLLNGVGLALMTLGVVLARRLGFSGWLGACLATLAVANGLSHTARALLDAEYNPGLLSGLMIWIPFGAYTLFRLYRGVRAGRFLSAAAVGAGIQVCVSLLAAGGGRS